VSPPPKRTPVVATSAASEEVRHLTHQEPENQQARSANTRLPVVAGSPRVPRDARCPGERPWLEHQTRPPKQVPTGDARLPLRPARRTDVATGTAPRRPRGPCLTRGTGFPANRCRHRLARRAWLSQRRKARIRGIGPVGLRLVSYRSDTTGNPAGRPSESSALQRRLAMAKTVRPRLLASSEVDLPPSLRCRHRNEMVLAEGKRAGVNDRW
jgi:hypothetical protein